MNNWIIWAAAAIIPVSASAPGSGIIDGKIGEAYRSINPADPYDNCRIISSPEFAGRLTGHEGYTEAARWAAARFAEYGLQSFEGDEPFLQPYPSPYFTVRAASMTLHLPRRDASAGMEPAAEDASSGKDILLEAPDDFLPQLFSDSGDHTADIVFAGWGISAPELGYDDYAGIDARGKFVICFRGTPDRSNTAYEEHDQHRTRMRTAADMGALGLFYIYPDPIANPNGERVAGLTSAIISEETADLLLEERNIDSKELKKDLSKYGRPLSFDLGSRITYSVEVDHFPGGVGYNVVGYLAGSSPDVGDEWIVIGAHFDHCGTHMGLHFAGANDNGSGSAVVLEIAEAFSILASMPRRPVIFILFGGEEKGLEGSRYFADHLPAGVDGIDGMFNFDMTGEGDGAGCGYTPDPPGLKEIIEEADLTVGTLRHMREITHVGVRSSDYAPFFLKGAACVSFYSNGPHLHYHKTGDTIYRINPEILADISRIGFLAAYMWADR